MTRLLLIFLVVAIPGCSAAWRRDYQKRIAGWVGKDHNLLIREWGPPNHQYKMDDGTDVLQYRDAAGLSHFDGPIEPRKNYCATNFYVTANGIIESARADGTSCGTEEKKRLKALNGGAIPSNRKGASDPSDENSRPTKNQTP